MSFDYENNEILEIVANVPEIRNRLARIMEEVNQRRSIDNEIVYRSSVHQSNDEDENFHIPSDNEEIPLLESFDVSEENQARFDEELFEEIQEVKEESIKLRLNQTLEVLSRNFNDADALLLVATHYRYGWGIRENFSKALRYYKKSARNSHPGACYELSRLYLGGDINIPPSLEKAKKYANIGAKISSLHPQDLEYKSLCIAMLRAINTIETGERNLIEQPFPLNDKELVCYIMNLSKSKYFKEEALEKLLQYSGDSFQANAAISDALINLKPFDSSLASESKRKLEQLVCYQGEESENGHPHACYNLEGNERYRLKEPQNYLYVTQNATARLILGEPQLIGEQQIAGLCAGKIRNCITVILTGEDRISLTHMDASIQSEALQEEINWVRSEGNKVEAYICRNDAYLSQYREETADAATHTYQRSIEIQRFLEDKSINVQCKNALRGAVAICAFDKHIETAFPSIQHTPDYRYSIIEIIEEIGFKIGPEIRHDINMLNAQYRCLLGKSNILDLQFESGQEVEIPRLDEGFFSKDGTIKGIEWLNTIKDKKPALHLIIYHAETDYRKLFSHLRKEIDQVFPNKTREEKKQEIAEFFAAFFKKLLNVNDYLILRGNSLSFQSSRKVFSTTSSPALFSFPRRRRPNKSAEGEEKYTQDRRVRSPGPQKGGPCLVL